MAIEFEFQGEWYKVDTPQEVVALKKYLRAHARKEENAPSDAYAGLPAYGKWTSDLFALLMEKIRYNEKKFLLFAGGGMGHGAPGHLVCRFTPRRPRDRLEFRDP